MDWNKTDLGAAILQQEIQRCQKLVPVDYYALGVQVGMLQYDYLEAIAPSEKIFIQCPASVKDSTQDSGQDIEQSQQADGHRIIAHPQQLPFAKKSVNLIALPHVLDYYERPHEILREVNAVLCPQGSVIITGFNIWSLFAATNSLKRMWSANLDLGSYYSLKRVQDWLQLLGFELTGAGMLAYQPAIHSKKWRQRLAFLEKAGDRWWPGLGGVYVIVARKKDISMTPTLRMTKPWRKLVGTLAPKPQRASGAKISLVVNNKDAD